MLEEHIMINTSKSRATKLCACATRQHSKEESFSVTFIKAPDNHVAFINYQDAHDKFLKEYGFESALGLEFRGCKEQLLEGVRV